MDELRSASLKIGDELQRLAVRDKDSWTTDINTSSEKLSVFAYVVVGKRPKPLCIYLHVLFGDHEVARKTASESWCKKFALHTSRQNTARVGWSTSWFISGREVDIWFTNHLYFYSRHLYIYARRKIRQDELQLRRFVYSVRLSGWITQIVFLDEWSACLSVSIQYTNELSKELFFALLKIVQTDDIGL